MIPEHLQRLAGDAAFIGHAGFGRRFAAPPSDDGTVVADLDGEAPELEPPDGVGGIFLIARTTTDLHRLAALGPRLPSGKRLVVAVADMAPQHRPTSIALPPTPRWSSLVELRVLRGPDAHWRVEARLDRPAPVGELIGAVVAARRRNLGPRAPRIGAVGPKAAHWTTGLHAVGLTADETSEYPDADIVVTTGDPAHAPTWGGHAAVLERPDPAGAVRRPTADPVHDDPFDAPIPPVDECTVNPVGFTTAADGGTAELRFDGRTWALFDDGGNYDVLPGDGAVTDADVHVIRGYESLRVDWDSHPGTTAGVRTVAALAAAGVPLVSRAPAPMWAAALGKDVLVEIDRYTPADLADPFPRELHSVRLRRAALDRHAAYAHAGRLRSGGGASVSVVLCTRRPEYLPAIIEQVNRQTHPETELIAVLHGVPKETPAIAAALATATVPLTVVEVPGETVFGEALNRGFRAASGTHVAKFDDDDWYSPHHLADLLRAERYSGAALVGAHTELIHVEEYDRTVRKQFQDAEAFTVHLSGGTLLMRREHFHALGGYRPVRTSEDRGLLQDVLAEGGGVYKIHPLGYVLSRRAAGHTWDVGSEVFLENSVREWPGRNLGTLVVADELEQCAWDR
ncbi:Glycosyltransferase involved in cell wall bisynthesis [Glycomyces sambucus]|uniref:Glycosyltransferase involved in cell wall bisynthesis n=1 Tax=Glycomyces sambucus TaxID=380244 RepID=A0A1G9GYX9_9ACTN|nr:glycosyltransferase [Glycomyces sambucus]SDL05784.1 Glycosyltransferase involved in cell wall bisynthesis [Glycomyces sambucus]